MVSILGCGWLGFPLACYLLKKGIPVKGAVTKLEKFEKLQQSGIQPYRILFSPELEADDAEEFFNCDILIVNFPPGRREDVVTYHPAQIRSLIKAVISNKIKKVLFVSSTSVYPNVNREVFENETLEPAKGSGQALKIAEDMLRNQSGFDTTVIRFGGLVGYDRVPGRFLAAKKDVANGNAPVNIIHRDDCIELIYQILKQSIWGETFNACADEHPLRKEYYTTAAIKAGLEPPVFINDDELAYKIVNADKIKTALNYHFKFPDPLKIPEL